MAIKADQSPAFDTLIPRTLLLMFCAIILSGILVAGLWPFHSPKNEVSWLDNGGGLVFGKYGSIVSESAFTVANLKKDAPCSFEIWLQPAPADHSGTILAFYRPDYHFVPFALRQSLGDLLLEHSDLDQRGRRSRFYVANLLRRQKSLIIAITSGALGTTIYTDGTLTKVIPTFRISLLDLTGMLIIGNSPDTTYNWPGEMKGVAIYNRDLTANEVSQHTNSWVEDKQPSTAKSDGAVALYLFNEGKGSVVHNQLDSATDFLIPEHFFVLHEKFLELPWNEFYPGWAYWKNVSINICGFISLGFSFCAYFSSLHKIKHTTALTIAIGFAVSLTIEVLQAFLPTRNSGMTDIITNALGTGIGAMFYGIVKTNIARGMTQLTRWFSPLSKLSFKMSFGR